MVKIANDGQGLKKRSTLYFMVKKKSPWRGGGVKQDYLGELEEIAREREELERLIAEGRIEHDTARSMRTELRSRERMVKGLGRLKRLLDRRFGPRPTATLGDDLVGLVEWLIVHWLWIVLAVFAVWLVARSV